MSRLASGCLLLAVAFAPALVAAETQGSGKGNKYALLVGCSKYLKTEFRELPYTGNDVKGFRDALVKTGFPDEQVVVLHDTTKDPARYLPQKANILKELDLLLDGMRPQDTLVVALSGHGLQFKGDPVSYFVPVDGKVEDKSTLIPLSGKDGLYEHLKKCKAQQKLLIVNACRNDPTVSVDFASKKVELVDEDRSEIPEGIAAIFSCQAGQKSYYDPDRKIALFFDHVIKAWKGEYDSAGEMTLEKFFEQVTTKTKMDANKNLGVAQTPSVQREYAGKWVIATASLAKATENERLLASDFADFTRHWLSSWNKAESWLGQHAAARLAAWREAANGGSPEAMDLFGNCLESGKGLPANQVEAVKWYRKSAELGNSWGQADLGRMYRYGHGVTKDHAEALKWLRKAAEQGNAVGQNDLGRMYEDGQGVPRDHVEAIKWYRKAAAQGTADGQNSLGWMYENGLGVAKDYVEAIRRYRQSAEQDDGWAQNRLGVMYENGRGVQKDEREATRWYRKSADQGNADGQNSLGWMYENGLGVAKDYTEAIKWYRKSVEQGNAWGQNRLGVMYDNGRGVAKDYAEAVKWFRKSADQGNADGENNLGLMYCYGRGVQKDDAEAFKWFRKSAEQGNALGQVNLGVNYEGGEGVAKDYAEAVKWYRKAADQGNADGQNNLGAMYDNGRGVAMDQVEALQWFRKAADQGNALGQKNLGIMYEYGRGVRIDLAEAVRWYRLASQGGNQDATEALRRLGKE